MRRRSFLMISGAIAASGTALTSLLAKENTENKKIEMENDSMKLSPPKAGSIPVAVLISRGATVIDFAGPWEVFQDVDVEGREAFQLFTVAETYDPIVASAGLKIVPNYTFADAPQPKIVMMGAQAGRSPATFEWLKKVSPAADVVMSVCTGAFLLAQSGLIDGKTATTHHDFYDRFEKQFPKVTLKRDLRFVEEKKFSSAGGLTSGIDMALRIVERYFGRDIAAKTAFYMEYRSKDWMV